MIERAIQCLKAIFDLAIHQKRNFIIDQVRFLSLLNSFFSK